MSIPEEAGKVLHNAIEGLKVNPSCLAAIMLAAMFALLIYFSAKDREDQYHARISLLLERCLYQPGPLLRPPQAPSVRPQHDEK